jgi:hypothetical protein
MREGFLVSPLKHTQLGLRSCTFVGESSKSAVRQIKMLAMLISLISQYLRSTFLHCRSS